MTHLKPELVQEVLNSGTGLSEGVVAILLLVEAVEKWQVQLERWNEFLAAPVYTFVPSAGVVTAPNAGSPSQSGGTLTGRPAG